MLISDTAALLFSRSLSNRMTQPARLTHQAIRAATFHVAAMCRVFQVSRSGYYRWLKAEPSLRTLRSQRIHASVRQVYEESHQIYGSHKIADQLEKDDTLEAACRNTVATAMREMSLKSRVSKKFSPTTTVTDPSKMPAPNILDQSFTADAPNRK